MLDWNIHHVNKLLTCSKRSDRLKRKGRFTLAIFPCPATLFQHVHLPAWGGGQRSDELWRHNPTTAVMDSVVLKYFPCSLGCNLFWIRWLAPAQHPTFPWKSPYNKWSSHLTLLLERSHVLLEAAWLKDQRINDGGFSLHPFNPHRSVWESLSGRRDGRAIKAPVHRWGRGHASWEIRAGCLFSASCEV